MNPDIRGLTSDHDALFHTRSYLGDLPLFTVQPPSQRMGLKEEQIKPLFSPFTSFGPDELKRYLKDVFMAEEHPVVLQDEDYDAPVKLLKEMLAWKPEERVTAKKALESSFFEKERMYALE
ncbi:hypothetical protein MMC14_002615 [Varicellaria rhodocarpa]|nr:hypothetical protein [Varicellaria rhodocarpa]